ncbi:LysR family transcriptional regulator [Acetobacteraceae bacterium H6797]|nr:LysR family transcriptional regulator [Acetobacteraceae bacterium H6797]
MNIRQVEIFRAVMQSGSVAGAARLLAVSAPAVSRMLRHTEDQLGYQLFERRAGRLLPTPEAEALWTEADAALAGLQRVAALASALGAGGEAVLRVAANPSFGATLLPEASRLFHQASPRARLDIVTTEHLAVVERIVLRRAELGLTQFAASHPLLRTRCLGRFPMWLALPANSPLAGKEVVPLAEAAAEPLITYGANTPIGGVVAEHFARHGLKRRETVTVRYPMIACNFVAAEAGVAFVDAFMAMDRARPGLVFRPIEPAPMTELHMVRHADRPLSQAARRFSTAVEKVAATRLGA